MNDKRVALHGEISRLLSDVAGQLAAFLEKVLNDIRVGPEQAIVNKKNFLF